MPNRNRADRGAPRLPDRPMQYKSAVMQRLQDLVRLGYTRYTSATCPVERLPALRAKFAMRYSTDAKESHRRRQKRWGIPRAYLVIWCPKGAVRARWWLLIEALEGGERHPSAGGEEWASALDRAQRIRMPAPEGSKVQFDYELKRIDGRWSWTMTAERLEAWQERINAAARAQNQDLGRVRQCAYSLRRVPGFRGIRRDAKRLLKSLRANWAAANPGSKLPIKTPPPGPIRRVSMR